MNFSFLVLNKFKGSKGFQCCYTPNSFYLLIYSSCVAFARESKLRTHSRMICLDGGAWEDPPSGALWAEDITYTLEQQHVRGLVRSMYVWDTAEIAKAGGPAVREGMVPRPCDHYLCEFAVNTHRSLRPAPLTYRSSVDRDFLACKFKWQEPNLNWPKRKIIGSHERNVQELKQCHKAYFFSLHFLLGIFSTDFLAQLPQKLPQAPETLALFHPDSSDLSKKNTFLSI